MLTLVFVMIYIIAYPKINIYTVYIQTGVISATSASFFLLSFWSKHKTWGSARKLLMVLADAGASWNPSPKDLGRDRSLVRIDDVPTIFLTARI